MAAPTRAHLGAVCGAGRDTNLRGATHHHNHSDFKPRPVKTCWEFREAFHARRKLPSSTSFRKPGWGPPPMGGCNPHVAPNAGIMQQDARGAWQDQQQPAQGGQPRPPPLEHVPGRDQIIALFQEQLGPVFRPIGRPMYTKPHSNEVNQLQFPKGFRVPEFHTFSGEDAKESTLEHVARFLVQCGEAGTRDEWKLRLFPNSLTATVFTWYINLPPNSIQTWRQMEEIFQQQFYRVEPDVTMADLSGLCQLLDEGVETYLARFKKARFKCKVSLPEREYVRLALNGFNFELKKKFYEAEFRDLFELSAKAARYERILRQEQDRMTASKGTYYRDPNYEVAMMEPEYEAEVAVAELINKKPYILKMGRLEKADFVASSGKSNRVYTFDITRAEAIFDQLMADKLVKLHPGHKFLPFEA